MRSGKKLNQIITYDSETTRDIKIPKNTNNE